MSIGVASLLLMSALGGRDWSDPPSGRFTPGEKVLGTH